MAGRLCSAVNCNNRQGCESKMFPGTSVRFHAFPKDIEKAKKWLINIRRRDLDKEDLSKFNKTKKVCSEHFENSAYNNPNERFISSLSHNAIPTLIDVPNPPKNLSPGRKPPKVRRLDNDSVVPSQSILNVNTSENRTKQIIEETIEKTACIATQTTSAYQNRCQKHFCFRDLYQRERKKNLKLYARIARLKKKMKSFKPKKEILGNFNPVLHRFIQSQKQCSKVRNRGMRWNTDDVKLALSIYYKSPNTYKFLRSVFYLPSQSVIYKELALSMTTSGICPRTLQGLKYKLDSMPRIHRCCSIVIDGMRIESSLQYMTNDVISGFEEKEGALRSASIANELLVFMVQGIASPWKQIIAYYFVISPAKDILLKHSLSLLITQLQDHGTEVKCIILDQEPIHQKLVNQSSGCFQEVPILFDPPHLLKSTRNSLLNYQIKVDGNTADFRHIRSFYDLDTRNPVRLAPRLREQHINPTSSQRMKVKFAAQVLSNSVAAGIETLCEKGHLPPDASYTAYFCREVNDLFDICNSSDLRSLPMKRPIYSKNVEQRLARLDNLSTWISR